MKSKYTNRYGDVYTFTKQEDGNVLWEGPFEVIRAGGEPDDLTFIDPSGGPFISKGQMLSHIIHSEEMNLIVEGFKNLKDKGILILTKPNVVTPEMEELMWKDRDTVGGII
tara:strand:+ start:48 stop:380 length:333 start_codon:yes stop_codon:yes gene_type:complete